jgi:hypothetical protein
VTAAIDMTARDDGRADLVVELTPADAADDARWFQVMAWQGDGFEVTDLEEVSPGRYEAEDAMPIVGRWKTVVRLHRGAELLAAPVYLPADPEIDAVEIPAEDRTVEMGDETDLLMREALDGSPTTAIIAYAIIAIVAAAWVASFAIAIRRIGDLGARAEEVRGRSVDRSTPTPTPA